MSLKYCIHQDIQKAGISIYSEEEKLLFSGDTLFNNSIGRSDLYGGDFPQVIKSIKDKLFVLDKETIVLPGHGNESTIGSEIKYNPFLQ